ncbi:hypothetical protein [Azospirillum sp. ST 5-10]|uniref:hypothetical protein n=1 Tax=unclassified Azospirillum TaxID=2630922 RepID=UPI003F49E943
MAGKHERSPEHAEAHDLAEKAIDKAIAGDQDKARDLAKQARKVDPKIGEEMAREVEEDRRDAEGYGGGKTGR